MACGERCRSHSDGLNTEPRSARSHGAGGAPATGRRQGARRAKSARPARHRARVIVPRLAPYDATRGTAGSKTVTVNVRIHRKTRTRKYLRLPPLLRCSVWTRFLRSLRSLHRVRENVDVVPEEVLGVVCRLDRSQPREVRSVRDRGRVGSVVFEVVDVARGREIRRE